MSASQPLASEAPVPQTDTESRGSLAPLLPGAFPTSSSNSSTNGSETKDAADRSTSAGKARKLDFWKLGKKTEEDKQKSKPPPISSSLPPAATATQRLSASQIAPVTALRPSSPLRGSASPQRSHPYGVPTSPGGGHSSSPRLHSPASSQIFERDVQEDVVPAQASPQIPSHIIRENHIPPALDASSEAITNAKLDPDSVEIITHATHQPAAMTITGAPTDHSTTSLHDDLSPNLRTDADNGSNYGSLDTHDVRRLSFISFADVVHGEHAAHVDGEARRDSGQVGLSGSSALGAIPRSPSPLRSPVSSHGLSTSPPTSVSASFRGLETSPSRGIRGSGSPPPGQPGPLGGELNIETMRQALRKTGSGDLSGFRSAPLSAVGNEDGSQPDKPFK